MQLVKKNLVSVICGVIALLAVVAIFWPINGWYNELQTLVTARASVASQISTILSANHALPQIAPTPAAGAEVKNLDTFPTRQVIDAWKGAVDKLKQDSADMLNAAVEMNKRDLLYPNCLPNPGAAELFQYRQKYQSEMDFTAAGRDASMPVRVLHGGFLPTQTDINTQQAVEEKQFKEQTGGSINDAETAAQLKLRKDAVPETLRNKAADTHMMYLETKDVLDPWAPLILLGRTGQADSQNIFISQVGYWIHKDIYDSLAAANAGATNVRDAAVKHLLKLKLDQNSFAKMQAGVAPPGAPADTGQWPQAPSFAVSITGRDTNSIYDVFRFDMSINVDAEKVPLVLQELSRGKFITITSCSLLTIDLAASQAQGLLYGDKPVVQLSISGEELFLRQWTKPLMPPLIRTSLNIAQDAPKP